MIGSSFALPCAAITIPKIANINRTNPISETNDIMIEPITGIQPTTNPKIFITAP